MPQRSTTAMAALLLSAPTLATANDREPFDRIISGAERVRREAHEVLQLLRGRSGRAAVSQRVSALETQAQALKASIDSLGTAEDRLTDDQTHVVERVRRTTGVLLALLADKAAFLGERGAESRASK